MNDADGVTETGGDLVPPGGGPPTTVGFPRPHLPEPRDKGTGLTGWRAKVRSVVNELLDVADELAEAVTIVVDQVKQAVKKG